ncbi:Ribosome biogenesis protein BMS1 like, partial [Dissostichus eleginoides]
GGTCKASNMQKVFQSVQRVAQKSCGRACEMFCCTSDTLMCEKVPCCTGAYHQPTEDKTTQEPRLNPPSTILIVNISNSTLMDCVIGNGTYQSMVADSQPLMRHAGLQMHDQRCSCSRGQQGAEQTSPPLCPPLPTAEPLNINIQRSNLNCVIIGDNNYMQAEPSTETEEPQE